MSETEPTTQPVATCDVFVLGGGPAGSTIAALLAERGWNVVVVEKERHPRFHIGESLLPLNLPLFEQLGRQRTRSRRIGMRKYGAEFVSPDHEPHGHVRLRQSLGQGLSDGPIRCGAREFDEILFRNCVAQGAQGVRGMPGHGGQSGR